MRACAVASRRPSKACNLSGMQLDEIRKCHTGNRGALDGIFEKLELLSIADKHEALLKAMGIGDKDGVFYSGCAEECDDIEQEQYEAVVGAFFSGFWVYSVI